MLPSKLIDLILSALPDAEVKVDGDDGQHFTAIVIDDSFINKKTIERQRAVYQAVNDYIASGELHALSLKTYTKEEWQSQ